MLSHSITDTNYSFYLSPFANLLPIRINIKIKEYDVIYLPISFLKADIYKNVYSKKY